MMFGHVLHVIQSSPGGSLGLYGRWSGCIQEVVRHSWCVLRECLAWGSGISHRWFQRVLHLDVVCSASSMSTRWFWRILKVVTTSSSGGSGFCPSLGSVVSRTCFQDVQHLFLVYPVGGSRVSGRWFSRVQHLVLVCATPVSGVSGRWFSQDWQVVQACPAGGSCLSVMWFRRFQHMVLAL